MEARDREGAPARGGAGGRRSRVTSRGRSRAQEGVEPRLRLQRHDARAGGEEGAGAIAGVGADVEGEIAGGDDAAVEGGEAGDRQGRAR